MNPEENSAILLLTCPDRPGIIAEVSHFVFANNGNIIHSDEHTDKEEGIHAMRVEWDLNHFEFPPERIADAFAPIAERFHMDWTLKFSNVKPRMAVFVSKLDHCLLDIMWRITSGEFQAEVPVIVSNHPDLQSVAEYFGTEFRYFKVTKDSKEEVEKQQRELMAEFDIDFIVLARYMQILSPTFIDNFRNRIINIHHSFLPAFAGAKPYHQAFRRGVKLIGASSHYATEELDQGPIIEQDVERVSHRDSLQRFIQKGRDLERKVLAKAVRLHLESRIITFGNKTMVFD